MTFKQLFEDAVKKVEGSTFEGRTSAIESVVCGDLRDAFAKEVAKTSWTHSYCCNSYGMGQDPYLQVAAHGCTRKLFFKVRLKKAGKKHSYYGDVTYYTPAVAFLTNEEMMDMEITDVLNLMYDKADDIREKIAEEDRIANKKLEYTDLIAKLTSAISEFNTLDVDVKQMLKYDFPSINYYF